MKTTAITPVFVTQFPDVFKQGEFYISEEFETAGHLCCCGCGEKVITPLNPAKWSIKKAAGGTIVSLWPSVGNWNYACKSHYIITKNRVINAGMMNARAIEAVRQRDKRDMAAYVAKANAQNAGNKNPGFLAGLLDFIKGLWGSK